MRTIIFVAAAILLAGCETDDDSWRPSHYIANEERGPAAQPQTVDTIDLHCQGVARQRAADARANGYSLDMEKTIYDGTYKDCVAWDASHRS